MNRHAPAHDRPLLRGYRSASAAADASIRANRGPVFALLCVAAQGAGLPRWSRTMATASRWVSLEPAENA